MERKVIWNYCKERRKIFFLILFLITSYNLYFLFLIQYVNKQYLVYVDFLIFICLVIIGGIDYFKFYKQEKKKEELIKQDYLIHQEFGNNIKKEVIEHDICLLQYQIQEQFKVNCDLQDYITKWCHEVKIPLAASFLMNEKIEDINLRKSLKEQLEKINQLLHSALLGCKVQSSFLDLQVKKVSLLECVKTSLHNNQYFLIQNQFCIQLEAEDIKVYTDKTWLVYIIDQLISNAIKYRKEKPVLQIWSAEKQGIKQLWIEDNGEGILDSDIRRIFEKGFIGQNHHNGKYKSTGMGLYMVFIILEKLGHKIQVESEYGQYTRFLLEFEDNQEFFHLEER